MTYRPSSHHPLFHHRIVPTAALSLLIGLSGCAADSRSEQLNSRSEKIETNSGAQSKPPSLAVPGKRLSGKVREGTYLLRSLLREAPRAELWDNGQLIDLGALDQHKYLRGGWSSGWVSEGSMNGQFAKAARVAKIRFHEALGGTKAIFMRARSRQPNQKVTLYLDKRAVATQSIGGDWQVVRYKLPKDLTAGRYTLTLASVKANKEDAELDVDWLWLAQDAEAKTYPSSKKVGQIDFGSTRAALIADPPRRFSYYLRIPRDAQLVFDYAATQSTNFTIQVTADGKPTQTVYEAKSSEGQWLEKAVGLDRWADQLVRLDLVTTGTGGKAGWGEPNIVRKGERPRVPVMNTANRPQNVIQILIDTVRQDSFKVFNPRSRVITPGMDRFAKKAVRFSNGYVQAPWTKPSIATIMSGLYPSTHDTQSRSAVLPDDVRLLSQHMKGGGFQTAAFIANGYVSNKFGFKKGWDKYRNYIREERISRAEHVYGDATRWLTKHRKDGRFYLYVHTIDPHVPYKVDDKFREPYFRAVYKGKIGSSVSADEAHKMSSKKIKTNAIDRKWVRALYDGEVSYHDFYFGRFLETLGKMGLLDDTLIIISNDHGEEQFDHGGIGHGHSLYEELIRSPMMLSYPKFLPRNQAVEATVGTIDLVPTILDLLGMPPMRGTEGRSLMPDIFGLPDRALNYEIAEFGKDQRAIRLGHYKLIATAGSSKLYHLAKDRGEKVNVADRDLIAHRACEIHLGEALGVANKWQRLAGGAVKGQKQRKKFKASPVNMDDKLRKQLEALGYIN